MKQKDKIEKLGLVELTTQRLCYMIADMSIKLTNDDENARDTNLIYKARIQINNALMNIQKARRINEAQYNIEQVNKKVFSQNNILKTK